MSKKTYSISERSDGKFAIVEHKEKFPNCGTVLGRIHKTRELAEKRLAVILENAERRNTKRRPAASPWRTDEPPKDGTVILAVWQDDDGARCVSRDEEMNAWIIDKQYRVFYDNCDPDYWAHINMPEGI